MQLAGNVALNERHTTQPKTYQSAVLARPGSYELREQTAASLGDREILIKLEGCGVCASSAPVWEGRPWFDYPFPAGAPGHEGWGVVVDAGPQAHLPVGQRVAFLADNAFAEYAVVREDMAVPLPQSLDGMPFPGEAIGCAMNIFRRADIREGQNVAIVGAGFLGLLLVQLARSAGARVFVLSRRRYARDAALHEGAEVALDTEDWWGNAHRIVEMTEGRGCDRVIEVTGLQFALDTATEMIAEYGRLVIAGFHQDGPRQVNMQQWNWRGIDVVNAHERDPARYVLGIEEGVIATESGRIHPDKLLTHAFELERLNDAFQMMLERPEGFIKGWVRL